MRGTYVTGLTDRNIQALDWFEGDEYKREKVHVKLLNRDGQEGGESKMAEVYVFSADPANRLEDKEWDFEDFRKEKMHRWADLSEEYKGELLRGEVGLAADVE